MKRNILRDIKDTLNEEALEVVIEKKMILNKESVKHAFVSPFDKNIYWDYICRGESIVLLIKGKNAGYKLFKIKYEFRKKYGFSKDNMENLIHTADPGNEYYIQYKMFFPECPIIKNTLYADMQVIIKNERHIKEIKDLDIYSNISYLGFVVDKIGLINKCLEVTNGLKNIKFLFGIKKSFALENNIITLIGYIPEKYKNNYDYIKDVFQISDIFQFINIIKAVNGSIILDYMSYEKITPQSLTFYKSLGINCVTIYDPRYTLEEVYQLEDLIEYSFKMNLTGGSNGQIKIGECTIDQYLFDKTFLHLVE